MAAILMYWFMNGSIPAEWKISTAAWCGEAAADERACSFPGDFHMNAYTVWQGHAGIVGDGDILNLGGRHIRVLHTPGHSPGHMCFLIWNGNGCTVGILSIKVFCTVIIRPLIHRHTCCRYKGCKR